MVWGAARPRGKCGCTKTDQEGMRAMAVEEYTKTYVSVIAEILDIIREVDTQSERYAG